MKAYAGTLEVTKWSFWKADRVVDLVIPATLATTSVAWEGDAARERLARLPPLVAEVEQQWDLEVGPPHAIPPEGVRRLKELLDPWAEGTARWCDRTVALLAPLVP